MTDKDWIEATRPWPLWHYLSESDLLADRKKRLFAVAACRRVAHHLTDPRSVRMIEVCEAYADGQVTADELYDATEDAFDAAELANVDRLPNATCLAAAAAKWLGCDDYKVGRVVEFSSEVFGWQRMAETGAVDPAARLRDLGPIWNDPAFLAGREAEERVLADLLREVFANPFRAATVVPAWLTTTSVGLARRMYDVRDFAALPVLADALEDAGCDDPGVLAHCRGPGPHVRGCWVVDLVLGKL